MTIEREILDPKLRTALDEIDAVLRKHAIGGHIALVSSTHAAFRLTLPSWSGIQLLPGEEGVHFKFKGANREHVASSIHAVLSLRDLVTRQSIVLCDLGDFVEKQLRKHGFEFEHGMFGPPEPEATT